MTNKIPSKSTGALIAGLALLSAAPATGAQSAQPHGAQFSVLAGAISFKDTLQVGVGGEAQLRFNRVRVSENGVLSVGVGAQYTHHPFAAGQYFNITGAFLEPRYAFVVSSERFFPYIAGRLAVLQQSSNVVASSLGYAAGGGGGIGFALSRSVNLDLGAAVLLQGFGNSTTNTGRQPFEFKPFVGFATKLGLNFGF